MSESVSSLFDLSVQRYSNRPAVQYFNPQIGAFVTKTWQEVSSSVDKITNAILHLDVQSEDRIAILSMTRPEWVISDIAIIKASCIVVPIYHSSLNDQVAYILKDSRTRIIFVENEMQLFKLREIQKTIGALQRIVIFDHVTGALKPNEIYFEEFMAMGDHVEKKTAPPAGEIASLVYTSGTTGEPKGAMITHDNFLYEALVIDKLGILSKDDVQLIFLPLAHIFARVLEFAWMRTGHLLAFAESIDKIIDNMAVIKPTFMAGVPRIFEKIRAKTIEKAMSGGLIKRSIAKLAFHESDKLLMNGDECSFKIHVLKRIVFDKIGETLKERFGGRLRFLVSGGAPLSPEVYNFFALSGVVLCEGYGLTETTAASCLNLPWALRKGSVGRALPGTEIRINSDGEILVRGRGVFKGFWQKPEETKAVLGEGGWFFTGDIGEIDAEGFVRIIDRKRDIIVTSQGKNIAPQRVENLVKTKSPLIAHVVVVGDRRPYLTALIALEPTEAQAFATRESKSKKLNLLELSANAAVYAEIKKAVALANESLASFEQIKRFHILDVEFVLGKQLTPTLKVKRKACITEFAKEIRMLYT